MGSALLIRKILLINFLIGSLLELNAQFCDSVQQKDTFHIVTKEYEGIIWSKNYPQNISDDKSLRWSPSIMDVSNAEKLIKRHVLKKSKRGVNLNNLRDGCPVIHENLSKYIRQYLGKINKNGEKIIEINCLWKEDLNGIPWKTHYIFVSDGCSFFWSIKVNLAKNKCFDYKVNGP